MTPREKSRRLMNKKQEKNEKRGKSRRLPRGRFERVSYKEEETERKRKFGKSYHRKRRRRRLENYTFPHMNRNSKPSFQLHLWTDLYTQTGRQIEDRLKTDMKR